MKSTLIALFLLISLIGFAGELEDTFNKQEHPPVMDFNNNTFSNKSRSLAQIDEKSIITEVGLEHTPWYALGDAVYTVVIKSDGSFIYTGEKNVEHVGKYTGHINTIDIRPLFQYINDMGFFSLGDSYCSIASSGTVTFISDQQTVYTMAATKDKRKIVKNYGTMGPLKLWALEKTIEAVITHSTLTEVK